MTFTDADIRRMHTDPPASPWSTWCTELRHPGVTFNPIHDLTWCACGHVVTDGDSVLWSTVAEFDVATVAIRAAWPKSAAEARERVAS